MQYSTNFNMNKPELNEQYRLSYWNDNTDIIDAEMQAIRSGTDDVMKETLLNFCYPIGSIYWSGVATNPHDLFGGTWVQIKDKFVWAKGDSDVLDATGGEKTHTLTTTEMPTHTHTFSGSEVTSGGSSASNTGNESSHTHSVTASGTVSSHSHGLNEHTHSVTASGSVTVKTNPTFTGSAVNTGNETAHESFSWTGSHRHKVLALNSASKAGGSTVGMAYTASGYKSLGISSVSAGDSSLYSQVSYYDTSNANNNSLLENTSLTVSGTCTGDHRHSVTASGSISGGAYTFTGSAVTSGKASGSTANAQPTFTGSAVTSGSGSSHNHSMAHTHKVTASGTNANAGGGGAHNNMPPYVVKYCWQRTA